nr:MAG TPA: hypothetical protein [Caudoviricetes sp.]
MTDGTLPPTFPVGNPHRKFTIRPGIIFIKRKLC